LGVKPTEDTDAAYDSACARMVIVAELNVSFAPMIVAFGASQSVGGLEAPVTPIKPEVLVP
jgi:hypothetical protein